MKGMHLLRDSSEPLNTFHWPGLIRRGTTYDCNSYSLIYLVACKKQSCSYIRDEEVVPCSSTFLPFWFREPLNVVGASRCSSTPRRRVLNVTPGSGDTARC